MEAVLLALLSVAAPPPYTVVRSATASVEVDREIGDLLVVGGKAEISGVVRGDIFAIDSTLVLAPTAVVLKPIVVRKGRLEVRNGAVLPTAIRLDDAALANGGKHDLSAPGDRATLRFEGSTVEIDRRPISDAEIELMKRVLPFDRFVPPAGATIASLDDWEPGLGLALEKEERDPVTFTVGGVARIRPTADRVRGSRVRGYRGSRGAVQVIAVELADGAAADALWSQLLAIPEARVSLSVKSTLGDGAHWFFRCRGRYVWMWVHDRWFFAVETRLGAEAPTAIQELQFSEQVLTALRSAPALASANEVQP